MVAAQNICWEIYEWTEDNSLKWFHCVLDWKVALKRICLLPSPWNLWILPYEVEKWILQYITKDVTQMWEWDHKEGWLSKNWFFWTVVLEKTLQSPLDSKENKPVNPRGNQPWKFIGRTNTEAPILWPTDAKSWFTGKDPDAGKDWRQKEKRATENEIVG